VYLVSAASPHYDVAGPDEAEVQLLAVDPSVRGRRIGEALLVALLCRRASAGSSAPSCRRSRP
jgi:ribosomal protein S18 acetylase RimI-like enzyme